MGSSTRNAQELGFGALCVQCGIRRPGLGSFSSRETCPETLRSSALALCVSSAEYAAPVWAASAHAKHVDVAINETARIVTGCLKPTPVNSLNPVIGAAPPES
ncbi:hypothetical protein QE152_g7997 [Popillia japonica]|uniref:Uncharacterized protein n=1 Tax=Popillia japonica TaxID=7064 RepID=A0AAW1MEJ1_POPJA